MNMKTRMLIGAGLLALASTSPAMAATRHKARTAAAGTSQAEEIRQLKAQVQALAARIDAQQAASQQATTLAAAASAKVEEVAQDTQATQAQVTAQASAMPDQVKMALASAPTPDKFYIKGLTITPGGFADFSAIYRSHFQGNDISTNFGATPFPNNRPGQVSEFRLTARHSRLSFLAEGAINANTKLSFYGEFDFLGAAQTANSNESNSFNPRIRNLYGTIDWNKGDTGIHLLLGDSWSLVTMNSKGITPRNEIPPVVPEAQYVPGFTWARQPQARITADFLDHSLWMAVSLENPQTTFGGSVPPGVTFNAPAGSGFDSVNTLSLNHIPDVVGKIAYEGKLGDHGLHMEAYGLYRNFTTHLNGIGNNNVSGGGFGGGFTAQIIPHVFDVQFSGAIGTGLGRYGTSQLPDVTFDAAGNVHPLHETMLLAGATLHATKALDIYGYAGEEYVDAKDFGVAGGVNYGYGNALANNSGCLVEGGTCAGNSRKIAQITAGLWQKLYQGSWGRAQVGLQYSHTERTLFDAVGGGPTAKQDQGIISFRYYPF